MKVPLSWLREYVPVDLPLDELARRLTMAGTEVGGVERTVPEWERVVVGRVEKVRPHPNADRLRLVTVDYGSETGEPAEVVCGAPNVAAGQKIAFASVGATLIDPYKGAPRKLKRTRIRGVVSSGMVCSERELGLSDEHEGILVLDPDAPIGAPLADCLGDEILDLDLTPNRGDCLAVLGVAREVAALTGQRVAPPPIDYAATGPPVEEVAALRVEDPDLCPRYTATVIQGAKVGPSPQWLVDRLAAIGQGSINNIVDVTNFVMFEFGQPLHAFDLDRVRDRTIVVRRAKPGERLVTLDGEDRELDADMLVIADPERAIGLAGVMGGANTEIDESTENVLLESANFNGLNNRRTARRLDMRTEATLRFEKGLRPDLAEIALRRATRLILEVAGGAAARGILDAWPERRHFNPVVTATRRKLEKILGVRYPDEQVVSTLGALGFGVTVAGDAYRVEAPYWRPDVRIPEDVAEELARVIGYDTIPSTVISGVIPRWTPDPARELRERVRDALVDAGLHETVPYPLTSRQSLSSVKPPRGLPEPMRLLNPIASDHEYLRTTMRATLLRTVTHNVNNWRGPIALFEVGRVYLDRGEGLPEEREVAAGALTGPRAAPHWLADRGQFDFYDARGAVEEVMDAIGLPAVFAPFDDATFAPGRCASVASRGTAVGVVGEVAPDVLEAVGCDSSPVAMFELDLKAIGALAGRTAPAPTRYEPFGRFPESRRDLAIVVDQDIPAGDVLALVTRNRLVARASVFDVYRGRGVAEGKKSLAISLAFQSPSRTLSGEDIARAERAIMRSLEREFGAALRA